VNAEQRAHLIEVGAAAIANVRAARWKQLVGDEHERVRSLFVEHESDQQRVEAAAVIDSLGITQDQWHSDAAVRWDGVTDYPTFRISAVENLPDYGSTLDSQPTKAEA